jgi:hypothetical protein
MDENTEARPWHLLNPKNYDSNEDRVAARMEICKQCPFLKYPGKICGKCKCAMTFKTKLEHAHCPIGKW